MNGGKADDLVQILFELARSLSLFFPAEKLKASEGCLFLFCLDTFVACL